jgi:hypothetical protein
VYLLGAADALLAGDERLRAAVDFGERFRELRSRLDAALAAGETTVDRYTFDALRVVPVERFGEQSGLTLGVEAHGALEVVTYDADGNEIGRSSRPVAVTFLVGQPTGGRWMIVDARPLASA